MTGRSTSRAVVLGVLAGIVIAVVYGILSEPIEFTFGLLVVGVLGGWLIGNAITYGAWRGKEHETQRSLRWTAVAISVLAWVGALALAFFISQALLPQASTPLVSRLTLSGFLDYFTGIDLSFIHFIALALMAFMAWRGAR